MIHKYRIKDMRTDSFLDDFYYNETIAVKKMKELQSNYGRFFEVWCVFPSVSKVIIEED